MGPGDPGEAGGYRSRSPDAEGGRLGGIHHLGGIRRPLRDSLGFGLPGYFLG